MPCRLCVHASACVCVAAVCAHVMWLRVFVLFFVFLYVFCSFYVAHASALPLTTDHRFIQRTGKTEPLGCSLSAKMAPSVPNLSIECNFISGFSKTIVPTIKTCKIGLSWHNGGTLIIFKSLCHPLLFYFTMHFISNNGHVSQAKLEDVSPAISFLQTL